MAPAALASSGLPAVDKLGREAEALKELAFQETYLTKNPYVKLRYYNENP
jgi:hypothetical protein